jgi:hypothetical protein
MKSLYLFACLLFVLTACQDDDDPNAFVCVADQVGDTVLLPDDSEVLLIDAVVQDNRCPCNALCITAGGVGVRLLSSANDTLLIGLGDQTAPNSTLLYNGFTLSLRSVTHREICNSSDLEQGDYCFDFAWE